jgi:IS30 family transposase
MAKVTQQDCDRIAQQLNSRPRKRHGYLTPAEVYEKEKK